MNAPPGTANKTCGGIATTGRNPERGRLYCSELESRRAELVSIGGGVTPLRLGPGKLLWLTGLCLSATLGGWAAEPEAKPVQIAQAAGASEFELLANIKVTSVSRTESTVAQSPAAIFVITPEMIRRSGATAIPELFRMVPGMNVARIDGNKWAIGARGLNARFQDKLLVQMDGRTLYNPLFSGVYWDTVDYALEDIERIEVIRGPGASVWGANAVNGIINIITKPAQETQGGLVSAGGGTMEQGFATFRYGGKLQDDLFFRLYGKSFTRDQQFSQGADPHDDWWGANGGLRLDWKPSELNTLTFDGGYLHSVSARNDSRPTPTAPFVFLNLENEYTDAGHALVRWTHRLDEENSWSLQAYWDRVTRVGNNGYVDLRWDTYDVDFQHQLALGSRHQLVYGAGYRFIDAFLGPSKPDDGFAFAFPPPHRRPHLVSAFVQDQITLVEDKLSLTLGSKFEHNDFTGFEVQPTGRLLWTPTRRQSVWLSASRAVRTPTMAEDSSGLSTTLLQGAAGVGSYPRLQGNSSFQSEEMIAYEIGHRAQATDTFSVDTALFCNLYHNLKVNVPRPPAIAGPLGTTFLALEAQNGMNGEAYGAELGLQWQPNESWRLHGSYTLLKLQLHRRAGLAASAEAAEGQSPQQQVYLQSSWNLPRNIEFDLTGRFVDKLSGFNPGGAVGVDDQVKAYFSLDARLGWRPRKGLEFEVVGQNLLDSHRPELGTSPALRSPLVEIQRSVYAKVTWRF